ncbi:hypothetical protein GZ77_22195 [Endozoicomonas montiporae]|uniref:Uncharacterized protein n=2 Tax=Endozoicomonas montiporae TaxID=1027273 RepID=A0A081N069_9GAMM|nr:hypothetical protein [Endozoicomonas montiporae]AMO54293.1 hypothetical protein EZMO1_0017 [Endozoicomonas montiporae CL-33]KEQ11842.1 hypothetical protein GZ77_22195 [Endozoicomonas montiporae]
MNITTTVVLSENTPAHQTRVKQNLCRWALIELQAKGYSNRVINTAIIRALKDFQGRKLEFIRWVHNTPSYRQNSSFDPKKQSTFISKQAVPAMASVLKKKGYVDNAVEKLVHLMISHAGDTGQCSIASLWQSAKDWPAIR